MKLPPLLIKLSIFVIEKRLPDSVSRRVDESLREKRQHRNNLFAHEGRLFPLKIAKKTIFCPKTYVEFIESLSLKSLDP